MERDGSSPEEDVKAPLILSVDEMIEQSIGRLNFTQILQAILVTLPSLFDVQQIFMSIFSDAQPTWHCISSDGSCTYNSNICDLPKTDWTWDSATVHTSIVSEWNLECASSVFAGMPATSFFVGSLLGGLILAALGDSSLGRKNLLCITTMVMSLAAFASAFSPNIWVYSVCRFICGFGRASVGTCLLILLSERVSKKWRPQAIMAAFVSFSIGMLMLAGTAYINRGFSWRNLYLWSSIPGIICSLLCHFFLYDSPRWLIMQGRKKDAIVVLTKLGSANQIFSSFPNIDTEQRVPFTHPFASIKIVLSRPWAVKRLLASTMLTFGIGLMYFGMFLGIGNLDFNIYLTLVFHGLLSLSSSALTFLWWVQQYNRKTSFLGFCTISGALCIIFSIIGKGHGGVLIVLELLSMFCASMAYNLVAVYNVELFPTCVRSCTTSLVRQSMILGSVFDPILVLIGKDNMMYTYGVFGLAMLLSGFLVLCLPETKGKMLCDTMEEQEFLDSDDKLVF